MTGMRKARYFAFEPFCLDLLDERLWKHDASIPLGHKAFAVLAHLVSHPNQLVTKDDLLASVWPDTAVSEAVLTTAMREIRAAVGDTARTPRFVQTVHGRGYRFIAPVVETSERRIAQGASRPGRRRQVRRVWRRRGGRALSDARRSGPLCDWYAAVQQGTRRIGFIAGEAGIGKTTLVELSSPRSRQRVSCGSAGGSASSSTARVKRTCRSSKRSDVSGATPTCSSPQVLRDRAPSWLAHLPSLADEPDEPSAPVPPERMLRELTEALEAAHGRRAAGPRARGPSLERQRHAGMARRMWPVAVTRRDCSCSARIGRSKPCSTDAAARRACRAAASAAGATRSSSTISPETRSMPICGNGAASTPASTISWTLLHRRTGGHPLFLASIVDELIQTRAAGPDAPARLDLGAIAHTIPLNVRQFIEHRFEQLSDEDQAILEAASVAGDPFSVAAVAAGTSLLRGADRSAMRGVDASPSPPRRRRHRGVARRDARRTLPFPPRPLSRDGLRADLAGTAGPASLI